MQIRIYPILACLGILFIASANLSAQKDTTYFKLDSVKAVDIGNLYTAAQMQVYQEEANETFGRVDMQIDMANSTFYMAFKSDPSIRSAYPFHIKNKVLRFDTCKECVDSMYQVISKNDKHIVLQIAPQDEGQDFVYQLSFSR